jgi:hypothetical protein
MIIPYYCTTELDLNNHKNIQDVPLLPISKIILGPTQSQETASDSIKYFLRECGYDESQINIIKSKIPYRG